MQQAADEAVARLKQRFGTFRAAAEHLQITPQAIRDWRRMGRVSHRHMADVSALTGIPVEVLRPDLYRGTAASAA